MADWLRPVFIRSKTPALGTDRQSSFSADDNNSEDGSISKLQPTARASSYIGIRSSTPPVSQTPDTFTNIRNPESVYHKPSADHMAETLKVVMMNQSSVDPVPIIYNSCILHVLEAYHDLRVELTKKEVFIEDLKLCHAKDIKDFEALASQWEVKEKDYKTELKNLEVLLSRTEGGMEKVTLARSSSAVHGSGTAAETIGRGINTIKQRNNGRNTRNRGNLDSVETSAACKTACSNVKAKQSHHPKVNPNLQLNAQTPSHPTSTLRKHSSTAFRTNDPKPLALGSSSHFHASRPRMDADQQQIPEWLVPSLTRSQLDALVQQQEEGRSGIASNSSTSSRKPSTHSLHGEVPHVEHTLGLGIDINEKHLPKIPSNAQTTKSGHTASDPIVTRYSPLDICGEILETSPRLGFSFKPGDDMDILAQNTYRDGDVIDVLGVRVDQLPSTTSEEHSETLYTSTRSVGGAQRPKSTPLDAMSELQPKLGIERGIQHSESLKRGDSTGSFITAIRDKSGCSSLESSRNSSRSVRQQLIRSSGSGEAITAAAKALSIAGPSARASAPRKKGTSSGTRERSSRGQGSHRIEEGDKTSSEQSRKSSSVKSDNGSPPESSMRPDKRAGRY